MQKAQGSPTGMYSHRSRPSKLKWGTRTVLSGKGSLRRAEHRRALACCAPFRPDHSTMGGSGGNTSRSYWASYKTERLKNTARASMGVDRSLHIRSLSEASRRTTGEEQDEARAGALQQVSDCCRRLRRKLIELDRTFHTSASVCEIVSPSNRR
jgi:hypothetical protein